MLTAADPESGHDHSKHAANSGWTLTACVMLGEMFGLVRGCMSCSTAQAELPEHALPQKAFVVGHARTGLPAMKVLCKCPVHCHCSCVLSQGPK